jgi:hypothetical protein
MRTISVFFFTVADETLLARKMVSRLPIKNKEMHVPITHSFNANHQPRELKIVVVYHMNRANGAMKLTKSIKVLM